MRYMNRDTYDIEEAKKMDEYEAKQKALLDVLNKAIPNTSSNTSPNSKRRELNSHYIYIQ